MTAWPSSSTSTTKRNRMYQFSPRRFNPHQYLRHTFCEIFHYLLAIFLPNFMYSSPIHMSSWGLNITYLGLTQKPAPTILHWSPRGPQTRQFWKTMQEWVWLLTYLSLLLGNYSHVTIRSKCNSMIGYWRHHVRPPVCLSSSVTLCIVSARTKSCISVFLANKVLLIVRSDTFCQKKHRKKVKENANLSFLRHRQPRVYWFKAHY